MANGLPADLRYQTKTGHSIRTARWQLLVNVLTFTIVNRRQQVAVKCPRVLLGGYLPFL